MKRTTTHALCAATVLFGAATVAFSQTAVSPPGLPSVTEPVGSTSSSSPDVDAEREKIWNSPTMLRARAWVQEYCQRSAKITPAEAQQYMAELEHMTPVQMKLWLLKFDNEEAMIRQQQSDFERTRRAGVSQAVAIHGATDQAYSDINRDETEAAEDQQQSLTAEDRLAANRNLQEDQGRDAAADAALTGPLYGPYGGYGGYPYSGYNPLGAYGGAASQLHIHVHPR